MIKLRIPESITTKCLTLQRLRYEDAEEIFYTYASKEEATQFVSWPTHKSIRDTRAYVQYSVNAWKNDVDFTYTIRLNDSLRLIGSLGLVNEQGKIQLGYIISPTQWGKGYATESVCEVMRVINTIPGIHRIGSFVDSQNMASIRVLQKSGFIEEARLEKWFRFVNQNNQPKDCILFRFDRERFQLMQAK